MQHDYATNVEMLKLSAKPAADALKADVKQRSLAFEKKFHRKPRLAFLLLGEDPASQIYVGQKEKQAFESGIAGETIRFPANVPPNQVKEAVDKLNADPNTDAILIQRPLPPSFAEEDVLTWIVPEKDVDAFHPVNVGRLVLGLPAFAPCTPAGVMYLLNHYGINVSGKVACVIGRSSIVGKPMAALLLKASATVIHCHSRTPDLPKLASQADILITAIGRANFVTSSFVKPGAVVVDVGINRLPDGKVVGDVAYDDVSKKASAITPVPGGVGPMTIAMVLANTVWSAERRESKK